MKLIAKKRSDLSKGATKAMRRKGKIPAIFYSSGETGEPIEIDTAAFEAALRKVEKGHLPTTVFTLDFEGKEVKAIVKGIDYDRISYQVIHLDFVLLKEDVEITVSVPVTFAGVAECVGIKLGGFLRQVIRHVKVKCLPKDIPSAFELDIRDLKIKQSKRLSDIATPQGVKPLAKTDEVIAVIAKR